MPMEQHRIQIEDHESNFIYITLRCPRQEAEHFCWLIERWSDPPAKAALVPLVEIE